MKYQLLVLLSVFACGTATRNVWAAEAGKANKPNIIFILADDLEG